MSVIRNRVLLVSFVLLSQNISAQNVAGFPDASIYDDLNTSLWLGSYGNFRITDKFFWAGELHYRRTEHNGIPYVGRIAQIYNRHGLKYVYSKNLSATLGGVLRLNFTPRPGDSDFNFMVTEPRIWYEFLFAMPFPRLMLYHRLRFEHRWSKSNRVGAEFTYRTRYRYKFLMKIPLNKPTLSPGAFYFSPDVEIIMQSGSSVVANPFEDLRIFPHIGYIFNPRIGGSFGMMYTSGQQDFMGFSYRQRWIMRFNVYISLDFRKLEEKIPEIKIRD